MRFSLVSWTRLDRYNPHGLTRRPQFFPLLPGILPRWGHTHGMSTTPPLHIVVSPEAWDAAWADGLRPGPAFTDRLLADAMAEELGLSRYMLLGVDTSVACANFEPEPGSALRWRITADDPLPTDCFEVLAERDVDPLGYQHEVRPA
jgi:hypothetical protein